MDFFIEYFVGVLPAYWAFFLILAVGFYAGIRFIGSHFSESSRETLSLWLMGTNETTWASEFCKLFDRAFSNQHFSFRCFVRSAIVSITTVLLLFLFFGPILGVLEDRTPSGLTLLEAILIGAAVNVIPDYLSLLETRWLLRHVNRIESVVGQIAVLGLDLVFSATIIWIGIAAYRVMTGAPLLSTVELLAFFSIYSIFFYSSFFTSIWAWVYCISTWFLRLFTKLGLGKVLDVQERPIRQVALVGAATILLVGALISPIAANPPLAKGQPRQEIASRFDIWLCSQWPDETCDHILRRIPDNVRRFEALMAVCRDAASDWCATRADAIFSSGDEEAAAEAFKRSCEEGSAYGCWSIGWLYEYGRGVPKEKTEAAKLYETACQLGEPKGCNDLGVFFALGTHVQADAYTAVELYQRSCAGGDPLGCSNLGAMHEFGRGLETASYERAIHFYRLACDQDEPRGCNYLGILYEDGLGLPKDESKAAALYQESCEKKLVGACTNLGWMYDNGAGVPQNVEKAFELYSTGCEGGNARGCTLLGTKYGKGEGVEQDHEKAVELYRKGCDGENTQGCINLAWMFENGEGVAQDDEKAVELYRAACEGGNANGCTRLGWLYEDGEGVGQDDQMAVELYRKGCDGGDAGGCTNLGWMYEGGVGVAQDHEKAVALYRKGCDGANARGCTNLGWMYENGVGVAQDHEKAVALYRRGCDGASARGCTNLGWMYENGEGVEQDDTRAFALFARGCSGKNADGCRRFGLGIIRTEYITTPAGEAEFFLALACKLDSDYCEDVDPKLLKQDFFDHAIFSLTAADWDAIELDGYVEEEIILVEPEFAVD